jgi:hypothetical protein
MGGEYDRSQGLHRGKLDPLYRTEVLFSTGAIDGLDRGSVARTEVMSSVTEVLSSDIASVK